jgi:3-methyladenine DNA glycosylase AlkD
MLTSNSTVSDVVKYLRSSGTLKQAERVRTRDIDAERILGIPKKIVHASAKSLGRRHQLAIDLWNTEYHEARLIAILVEDPGMMDVAQAKDWINSIWSWDLCDHFARYLLPYIRDFNTLIGYCAVQRELYVKRTAFAGIACSLIHRPNIDDETIEQYLQCITEAASDNRHHVRKAVVWALVEIGKCNFERQELAIIQAAELMEGDKAEQWVGRNALKELENLVKVSERRRLISSKSKTGSKSIGNNYA